MRSIFLDELLEPEIDAVVAYLDNQARPSGINGLYWLPLERELWNDIQLQGQQDESWGDGYRFAVEVGPDWVRFELLVRSESLLNIGGGQADERQALFVLRWVDNMARKLNLMAASCLSCAPSSPDN